MSHIRQVRTIELVLKLLQPQVAHDGYIDPFLACQTSTTADYIGATTAQETRSSVSSRRRETSSLQPRDRDCRSQGRLSIVWL